MSANNKKIVHVIGTGTIGEPLIALLSRFRTEFGLDEVTFHKRTPILYERAKVKNLLDQGAALAVDDDVRDKFVELGIQPSYSTEEALQQASVVIDCTPCGNKHKVGYEKYLDNTLGFIAQGSEFGFGKMYARGINDSALKPGEDRFIHVVSCNTHNLAVLINTIGHLNGSNRDNLEDAHFLCIRRANDLSQDNKFIPSPQVGEHSDERFGTHHARDAWHLLQTLDITESKQM